MDVVRNDVDLDHAVGVPVAMQQVLRTKGLRDRSRLGLATTPITRLRGKLAGAHRRLLSSGVHMAVQREMLQAGAIGAVIATIATMVFFDDARRDAAKWRKHVDYRTKCIDTKDDGSSVDHCLRQREATARAFDKWRERCIRFDRPAPSDCDKQLQQLE
jgi:hypothetical protein